MHNRITLVGNLCKQSILKFKITFLLLSFSFFISNTYSYATTYFPYDYEIKCAGNGEYGFYLVTVSAFVNKKKDINHDITKKCAIHAVLYKGFTGDVGCHAQKSIIDSSLPEEHKKYITNLIENQFKLYTSSVDEMLKVLKVGKKYKVTAVIEVNAKLLRNELEKKGIIRKLGF